MFTASKITIHHIIAYLLKTYFHENNRFGRGADGGGPGLRLHERDKAGIQTAERGGRRGARPDAADNRGLERGEAGEKRAGIRQHTPETHHTN